MVVDARKHTVPPGTGVPPARQALLDLSLSLHDVVPVANATERAQLVADLTAAGVGPAADRPLYVHRTDAPAGGELERTVDGQAWQSILAGVGQAVFATGNGGGNLGTGWAVSSAPATLDLTAGRWLIHWFVSYTLSPGVATRIEAHQFTAAGAAIGTGQQDILSIATTGGTQSQTRDFARFTELQADTSVQIRRRTTATGGVQSMGLEAATALRVG
jgi:hypothetical protein